MSFYLEKLSCHPLVLDGAMGTMLYERGVFINACYDELVLTRPELVRGVHAEYVEAGADMLLTNSFGANSIKLRPFGLAQEVAAINSKAAKLAREAAGRDILVAGDMGPCLGFGTPMTDTAMPEVLAAFEEQAGVLAAEGVDLLFLETFSDLRELQLAAEAARGTGLPVHASFTVDEEGKSAVGMAAITLIDTLEADDNVDTLGLNCAVGPAALFDLLETLLPRVSKPVLVKPNAGIPREIGGRMLYMTSPEYFTEYAKRFLSLGVRGIGGCCGTTPEHIKQAAQAIRALRGIKEPARPRIEITESSPAVVTVTPTAEKSPFAAKLMRGERVTSIEVLPPKSPDLTAMLAKVRECHAAGVDAINIPDGPRASARVSPMMTALLIKTEVGIEPIPHYCCRDRNLLGMQSDLLGAAAAGLNNFLIITGDVPKTGGHLDVKGVFEIDSIGLTQLINSLNNGRDFGGNVIDPPTSILIGVGANPSALEIDKEVDRFVRKIDAGAEYAITQPVFDPDSLPRFLDLVEKTSRHIPVLAGIWPLVSYKNAEFLRNEVPGVVVSDAVMERLSNCETKEAALNEGVDLAQEMIEKLSGYVAGFQVSAPFGNVKTALRVLGYLGQEPGLGQR